MAEKKNLATAVDPMTRSGDSLIKTLASICREVSDSGEMSMLSLGRIFGDLAAMDPSLCESLGRELWGAPGRLARDVGAMAALAAKSEVESRAGAGSEWADRWSYEPAPAEEIGEGIRSITFALRSGAEPHERDPEAPIHHAMKTLAFSGGMPKPAREALSGLPFWLSAVDGSEDSKSLAAAIERFCERRELETASSKALASGNAPRI